MPYRCPRCDVPAQTGCDHIGPHCHWQNTEPEPTPQKDAWAEYGWTTDGETKLVVASGEDASNERYSG